MDFRRSVINLQGQRNAKEWTARPDDIEIYLEWVWKDANKEQRNHAYPDGYSHVVVIVLPFIVSSISTSVSIVDVSRSKDGTWIVSFTILNNSKAILRQNFNEDKWNINTPLEPNLRMHARQLEHQCAGLGPF